MPYLAAANQKEKVYHELSGPSHWAQHISKLSFSNFFFQSKK